MLQVISTSNQQVATRGALSAETHMYQIAQCPALWKQYHGCGKLNHFQNVCRKTHRQPHSKATPKISQIVDNSNSEDYVFGIECVGAICHSHQGQYFVPLTFKHNGKNTAIKCQLVTGAPCNVMSYTDLYAMQQSSNPNMQSTTARLKFYNNDTVCAFGECTLCCQYKRSNYHIHFKIITGTQHLLLSDNTC